MLTIKNVERLKNKVIGKTGYYVSDIKPVVMTNIKAPYESTHVYMIEITNRMQVIMAQLNRDGFSIGNRMKLYELKLGQNYINLNKFKLRNMDLVVDRINKLVLEQYVP
jgi:hypothetical protein